MLINVRTNFPDVARQLGRLQDDMAGQVLARSINRTMDIAKTAMSRDIRSEYNLTTAYVNDRLRIKRAFAKSGQFSVSAEMIGGGGKSRSANMIGFVEKSVSLAQARKRAKAGTLGALFVNVKRKGGKQELKGKYGLGAFIGNKGRTVFERTGKSRLPIRAVRTIDVAQMFNTRRINAAVVAAMNMRFPVIFERELRFALSKAGL